MKNTGPFLCLSLLTLLFGGCEGVTVRKYSTHGPTSGNTAGSNDVDYHQTAIVTERDDGASNTEGFGCTSPFGIIEVAEDTSQDWFQTLTTQYRLPATTPLLTLLIQHSGCFIIADPNRNRTLSAYGQMQSKEDLALYGDLGSDKDVDYILSPSIKFAQVDGTDKRVVGSVLLTLTDARSHAQVDIGIASNKHLSFGALVDAYRVVGMEAWQNTPHGPAISDALMDAFSDVARAAGHHEVLRADEMGRREGHASVLMPVRQAQIRLAELTFYSGVINGVTGAGMTKALSEFQRAKGLPVTGKLDWATSAALER